MIINKKKVAWNRYKRRKTTPRCENYCKIRNEATTTLRESKNQYEKEISKESKKNPQAVYGYMRSKIKIKEDVTRLKKDDGSFTSDDKENSKVSNEKFQKVFVHEPEDYSLSQTMFSMEIHYVILILTFKK